MRILYLANPGPDYLQDAVFHGLVKLLGPESVIDFPPNEQYHGRAPDERFSMLGFDVPRQATSELADEVRRADAIVIASLREGVRPHAERVLAMPDRPPTVFIDGEDDPYVRSVVRDVDHYYKREVLKGAPWLRARMPVRRLVHTARHRGPVGLESQVRVATKRTRGITPLPFGVIDLGGSPSPEKEFDVAFAGGTQNPSRALVTSVVERLEREGYRVFSPKRPVPWREYISALRRSRIGIAARGLGFDTYRYWEVPWAGALLVAERPKIVIPHDFVHGREAVLIDVDRIEAAVREWLARDDAAEVARAGREKVLSWHTSEHRAAMVLEAITSSSGAGST